MSATSFSEPQWLCGAADLIRKLSNRYMADRIDWTSICKAVNVKYAREGLPRFTVEDCINLMDPKNQQLAAARKKTKVAKLNNRVVLTVGRDSKFKASAIEASRADEPDDYFSSAAQSTEALQSVLFNNIRTPPKRTNKRKRDGSVETDLTASSSVVYLDSHQSGEEDERVPTPHKVAQPLRLPSKSFASGSSSSTSQKSIGSTREQMHCGRPLKKSLPRVPEILEAVEAAATVEADSEASDEDKEEEDE